MNQSISVTSLASLLAGLLLACGVAQAAPTVATILQPGAENTSFFDVNNSNTVVGYSTTGGVSTAFTWTEGGGFVGLSGPAGTYSANALGISDTGTIVGSYSTSASGGAQGFIFNGLTYGTFNIAGATNTFLRAISPNGQLITGYYDAAGIVGQGFVFNQATGFVTLIGAGGNDLTIPQGITDLGIVVGSDIIRDDVTGAVLSRPGFMLDLATNTRTDVTLPGTLRTAFRAITDAGIVSGWGYASAPTAVSGFSGYPGVIDTYAVPGFASTFIEGSNNSGWLVGQVLTADGFAQGLLIRPSSVPVSGTLALSLLGLGLAGALRRRRLQGLPAPA